MDITPYVDSLRRDLLAAAESAGPEVRAAAERLTYALEPATRLALMEAISQAATEITAEMPAGGVDVRLDGRDLGFVVDTPVAPAPTSHPAPAPVDPEEESSLARVTLRIPEAVKARAEELAARSGHSLNTWLVGVVRSATSHQAPGVDLDLTSLPGPGASAPSATSRGARRLTGWL